MDRQTENKRQMLTRPVHKLDTSTTIGRNIEITQNIKYNAIIIFKKEIMGKFNLLAALPLEQIFGSSTCFPSSQPPPPCRAHLAGYANRASAENSRLHRLDP